MKRGKAQPYEATIFGRPGEIAELDANGNLLLMDGGRFRLKLLDPSAVDLSTVRLLCLASLRYVSETGQFLKGWYFCCFQVEKWLETPEPPRGVDASEIERLLEARRKWPMVAAELEKPENARRADEVAGVAWFEQCAAGKQPRERAGEPLGPCLLSVCEPNGNASLDSRKEGLRRATPQAEGYRMRIQRKWHRVAWDAKEPAVLLVDGVPHQIRAEGADGHAVNPEVLGSIGLLRICRLDISSRSHPVNSHWHEHDWTLDGRSWMRWCLRLGCFPGNEFYRSRLENTLDNLKCIIETRLEQDSAFQNRVAWVAFAADRQPPAGKDENAGTYFEPIFLSEFEPIRQGEEKAGGAQKSVAALSAKMDVHHAENLVAHKTTQAGVGAVDKKAEQTVAGIQILKDFAVQENADRDEWRKNPLGCGKEAIADFMLAMGALGIPGIRAHAVLCYGYGSTQAKCAAEVGVSVETFQRDLAKARTTPYGGLFSQTKSQRLKARRALKNQTDSFALSKRLSEEDKEKLGTVLKQISQSKPVEETHASEGDNIWDQTITGS